MKNQIEIINKKASFNYDFVETYVAGIVLHGAEIVAIKEGNVDISEAYCYFIGNELFLKNSIVSFSQKAIETTKKNPNRIASKAASQDRKLLLNKDELKKIREQVKIKGLTVVPYKIIVNEKHLCKVVIAVAKGKKAYNKKQAIKERDIDRQIKLEM